MSQPQTGPDDLVRHGPDAARCLQLLSKHLPVIHAARGDEVYARVGEALAEITGAGRIVVAGPGPDQTRLCIENTLNPPGGFRTGTHLDLTDRPWAGEFESCTLLREDETDGQVVAALLLDDVPDFPDDVLGSVLSTVGCATLGALVNQESELRRRAEQFRPLFHDSPLGLGVLDLRDGNRGRLIRANPALVELLGYDSEQEMIGMQVQDWTPGTTLERDARRLDQLIASRASQAQYTKTYQRKDGSTFEALVTTSISGADTPYPILISQLLDVTHQRMTDRALDLQQRQFRAAFEESPNGMLLVRSHEPHATEILMANRAMAGILGVKVDDLVGRRTVDFLPEEEDRAASRKNVVELGSGRLGEDPLLTHRRAAHADGHLVDLMVSSVQVPMDGAETMVLSHVVDVTSQLRYEDTLRAMAMTDALTGLANRNRLAEVVDRLLSAGRQFAVLMLDLDRFKDVNDTAGHQAGDELLTRVARRLQQCDRRWTVARVGGDEFVVVVPDAGPQAAAAAATTLMALILPPIDLKVAPLTVSIGIATTDTSPPDRDELLRRADLAMYDAKAAGRNTYRFCTDQLLERASRRVKAADLVARALDEDHLELHLQPIVALGSGRPVAHEALLRIRDPQHGLLLPGRFIEVAEETGQIVALDRAVLARAVALVGRDPRLQDPSVRISVNVSGRTLVESDLLDHLREQLKLHSLPGERLVLELTERSLVSDDVRQTLGELRDLGVLMAVDDFGIGYSMLSYLPRFDMDHLKIDRSFVAQMSADPRTAETVRAIITLAHAHEMRVTAEGVETAEQAAALAAMGCDLAQGWHFGRPSP